MPPLKTRIRTLSKLAKYMPVRKLIGAGVALGGITIAGKTLMSGYADMRERTTTADTNANIANIGAQIEQERQTVKNDMYRNIIQREEWQRSPEVYDLQNIGSIGKTPGQPTGTKSYTGLIILAVIAVAAIYLLSGALKK